MKTLKNILVAMFLLGISTSLYAQLQTIDYTRPLGLDGVNTFETKKTEPMDFDGLRLQLGAGFTQQFQMLSHKNVAVAVPNNANPATAVDLTKLINIGNNFNNATANLNIDVQLEKGVKVSLVTYLSARHHQEAWVKGGYIQFDRLPFFPWAFVDNVMDVTTIKIGHMEINYGDQHFRRTDNGNASWNPFVGNTLLDAFTTEIGTEIYVQKMGFLGMVALTNGEIQGSATAPEKKTGSLILKGGYDSQISSDLRVRLTGSYYANEKAQTNSLFAGDRTGSRYYWVMENTLATATANAFSGTVDPKFKTGVTAFQINPFVKFKGFELFGIYEVAKGQSAVLTGGPADAWNLKREINQLSGEVIYRFDLFGKENGYVGGRYNKVTGPLLQDGVYDLATNKRAIVVSGDQEVTRMQVAAGWYFTKNVLAKVEYVTQNYSNFIATDLRSGGNFNGIVLEAVIGF